MTGALVFIPIAALVAVLFTLPVIIRVRTDPRLSLDVDLLFFRMIFSQFGNNKKKDRRTVNKRSGKKKKASRRAVLRAAKVLSGKYDLTLRRVPDPSRLSGVLPAPIPFSFAIAEKIGIEFLCRHARKKNAESCAAACGFDLSFHFSLFILLAFFLSFLKNKVILSYS